MAEFKFGVIGDQGSVRHGGTLFYYRGISTGPAVKTVAELVRSFQVSDIINLGDLTYNTGASTLYEDNNGQFFNDFMAPYPSPEFKKDSPYRSIQGKKIWPYDLYDYPNGFPHPVDNGLGGSKDGINRYWPTAGNHDYGSRVGYRETNVSVSDNNNAIPIGKTSTKTPQPFIDYFGWLANPSLLQHQTINVGSADGEGYQGIYYSTELGTQNNGKPLIELFSIDTERILMNGGYHRYLMNGFGTEFDDAEEDFNERDIKRDPSYDPTQNSNSDQLSPDEHKNNGYKQFQWLENGILNSQAKWKIIIGHHPVYGSAKEGRSQNSGYGSTPALQRLLKALPEGSVDAYFNGHAHYYQRVLESNNKGIGLGIPFITLGNSGRGLYPVNESWYGDNIYYPRTRPNLTEKNKKEYGQHLLSSDPITAGISGFWGWGDDDIEAEADPYSYGFGAGSTTVDDSYFLFQYQQSRVLDPAIKENLIESSRNQALDGWGGLTQEDWAATKETDDEEGTYLDPAELEITFSKDGVVEQATVKRGGSGYMQSKDGNHTVDFEIRGNETYLENQIKNPFDRAIIRLTFKDGKLDTAETIHGGSGYRNYVQWYRGRGFTYTPTESVVDSIFIHPFLDETWYMDKEAEYFGQIPSKQSDSYKDWYLITDTSIKSNTVNIQNGIKLNYKIQPKSNSAQDLLRDLSLTTGYSGQGHQNKYQAPQQGLLSLHDSSGTLIGSGTVKNGEASIQIKNLPKPGDLTASFNGDASSSYQVNFKPSTASTKLEFGDWKSGISRKAKSFSLSGDRIFTLSRTDQEQGLFSFGIMNSSNNLERIILSGASAASSRALDRDHLFSDSWKSSEGHRQGDIISGEKLSTGTYIPIAKDSSGQNIELESVVSHGNTIIATFAGGIEARFTAQGTGFLGAGAGSIDVKVSRLGWNDNGLAFYESDPITGSISIGGNVFFPGDTNYLSNAFQLAVNSGTYLSAEQLPNYGGSQTYENLPLEAGINYGILLLHSDDSTNLSSSYNQANLKSDAQIISLYTPGRGITYGVEDIHLSNSDRDYNDLIITMYADQPQII